MAVNIQESLCEQFTRVPYKYENGPDQRSQGQNPNWGINCQWLVHEAIKKHFGFDLPPYWKSEEIFSNPRSFQPVFGLTQVDLNICDIFLFNNMAKSLRRRKIDPKDLHLAVFEGDFDYQGVPFLTHASPDIKGISTWPLSEFVHSKSKYELIGIRRLNPDFFKL